MKKQYKIPTHQLLSYTELLYKLRIFSEKDKEEILRKIKKK